MTTTQTKSEYLLDAIATRLGVVKPGEDQVFSPEPVALVRAFIELAIDPAAAKNSVAALDAAAAKASAAAEAAKKATAELAARESALAESKAAQEKKLADNDLAHQQKIERRTRDAEAREAALAVREKEVDEEHTKLKSAREDLKRRLDAIRTATA